MSAQQATRKAIAKKPYVTPKIVTLRLISTPIKTQLEQLAKEKYQQNQETSRGRCGGE